MKRQLAWLLIALPTCTLAQGLVQVEVVNEPLIVEHPVILPSELRSSVQSLSAKAMESAQTNVSFNDLLVELREISWAPTRSTATGSCQILISINNLIAFVGQWQPPGGKPKELLSAGGIAGIWEPPVGIVFTPNDTVGLEVHSVNADPKDEGVCEADFVVLATKIPGLTDGL